METEASGETCDQTVQRMPHSDRKEAGVREGASEEPEPQMLSGADVTRRTAGSGTRCPHCRYMCGSRFSFQIHVGSQHPLHCEDARVGRLGKVVFYQRTAKLFHCHICFFTSRDYAVLFEHLLSRHCRTVRKGGEVNDQLDPGVRPREQDLSPEINPDAAEQRAQEASGSDCLKRKRSPAPSGEDEGVSESPQATSEARISRHHDVPKSRVCEEGSETFMTRHINLHHTQDLHQCPYCPFTSSLQGLHQHLGQCRAEDSEDKGDRGTGIWRMDID